MCAANKHHLQSETTTNGRTGPIGEGVGIITEHFAYRISKFGDCAKELGICPEKRLFCRYLEK